MRLHFRFVPRRVGALLAVVACASACSASPTMNHTGAGVPGSGSGGADPFGNTGTAGTDFGNTTTGHPTPGGTGGTSSSTGCAHIDVNVDRVIPRVMLVVDGSGSMSSRFGVGTRWTEVRKALLDPTMGLVKQLEGTVEFGLTIYSRKDVSTCPNLVQVPSAIMNFNTINAAYPQKEPGGGTPTGEALKAVVAMLPDVSKPAPDIEVKPQLIILATDGQPNGCGAAPDKSICPDVPPLFPGFMAGPSPVCVANYFSTLPPDYQGTVDAVRGAKTKGIDTYTISLAPAEQQQAQLQRVANVGVGLDEMAMPGAPIFEPSDSGALRDTLLKIVGGAVGCQLALQGKLLLSRACEGVVMINGLAITCDTPDGWKALDETHIELTGKSCTEFLGNPSVNVSARWPCGVVVQ